ncbi:hypothetical protein RF11_01898 [Thelohanellus kitauei]|uniref:Uncharacterized protein n=1 Tax=Thelohanellus kitauei TaxID=669202 RepID=A0A0C2MYE9_THEKT|nr:hypothetical protein RF11_01898 [Thelohanellus kitauei]
MDLQVKGVVCSILILMDSVNFVSGGKLFKKNTSQSPSEGVIRLHDPNSRMPGNKFSSIWPSGPFRSMSIDDTVNTTPKEPILVEKSPKTNIEMAEEPTTSEPASFEESQGTSFGFVEQQAMIEPAEMGEISKPVDEPAYIELPKAKCRDIEYRFHFIPALRRRNEPMTRGSSYDDAIGNVAKCFFDLGSVVPNEAVQRFLRIENCFNVHVRQKSSYSFDFERLVKDFFVCLEEYRKSAEYTKNFVEVTWRPHPLTVDYPSSKISLTSILRSPGAASRKIKRVKFDIPGDPVVDATEDLGPDGEPLSCAF